MSIIRVYLLSDPYHHRQLRSVMTENELNDHLNYKTLYIHALGNAACDSSLGHLLSYVNDTDSHITLRSSAVDALAKYDHKYVSVKYYDIYSYLLKGRSQLSTFINAYRECARGRGLRSLHAFFSRKSKFIFNH